MERLAVEPELLRHWHTSPWRQWYAALWVEAAVLAGHPDAPARLARARFLVSGNAPARALVDRAAALASDDVEGLRRAADARSGRPGAGTSGRARSCSPVARTGTAAAMRSPPWVSSPADQGESRPRARRRRGRVRRARRRSAASARQAAWRSATSW